MQWRQPGAVNVRVAHAVARMLKQAAGSEYCEPAPAPEAAEPRRRPWCLPCCAATPRPRAEDDTYGKKWITLYDTVGNRRGSEAYLYVIIFPYVYE